ncbi:MAG: transposase [Rhodobacteraceae bacterium]|nr:transposase [Paracoccaceae bacterium]
MRLNILIPLLPGPIWTGIGCRRDSLLREHQDRVDFDDEDWANRMGRLRRHAIHAVNQAGGQPLPERLADRIGRRTDSIVAGGLAWHEARPHHPQRGVGAGGNDDGGHNLVLRLPDNREDVLRFTRDPTVPVTNNEAERALRPLKVQQKISGSFRSPEGARNHAVLRTVLDTARKQDWNLLETLQAPPDKLIKRLEMSGTALRTGKTQQEPE